MSFPGINIDIMQAINSRQVWGPWFRNRTTWEAWFAFLRAMFGLPMSTAEIAIFSECTGRTIPPLGVTSEAWLVCGRRSGKSFILALIAVWLAVFKDWSQCLVPGERAIIMVIANDRKQARVIFKYAKALICKVPALAALVWH